MPLKYFIERKDTKEWLFINITPKTGYGYYGDPFEDFPNLEFEWTKDPNRAFDFKTKEKANETLETAHYLNGVVSTDCEATEHEFVNH